MAGRFDGAARLAEGRPAVEHTQSYVWACHILGYQHPDLTLHDSQVRGWYEGEEGLDLRVLDGDCDALWSAVNIVEEARRIQRTQLAELAAVWTGPAADFALGFLRRHCEAADEVVAGVRAAAEGCGTLRDTLWEMLDHKVAVVIAIDDRRRLERPAWLAAAAAVTAGLRRQSEAGELVDRQIKPYVDNDIRTDWLTAVRSTRASVTASYDAVIDGLAAAPTMPFQVPGDLGLSCRPVLDEPVSPAAPTITAPVVPAPVPGLPSPPADTVPADAEEPVSAPLDPVLPTLAAVPGPSGPAVDSPEALPPAPTLPRVSDVGTALGDFGELPAGVGNLGDFGGLGSLIGRIAQAIGGLVGSLTEGLAGPSAFDGLADTDDPFDKQADDPFDQDDNRPDEEADDKSDDRPEEVVDAEADHPPDAESGEAEPPTPGANPPDADDAGDEEVTAPPVDASPPAGAASPAGPQQGVPTGPGADGSTPCEIAADELPQAGQ